MTKKRPIKMEKNQIVRVKCMDFFLTFFSKVKR